MKHLPNNIINITNHDTLYINSWNEWRHRCIIIPITNNFCQLNANTQRLKNITDSGTNFK